MSNQNQHPPHHKVPAHRPHQLSAKPYVTGFILSLAFTIIPYVLVTNHMLTSTVLLDVILGFGFLQMAVQIFFFLHLGRGPKPLYNVGFFVGTFSAILVVVVGSIFIMDHLHNNMTPTEKSMKLAEDEGIAQIADKKTGACQGLHANHKVAVKNGVMIPGYTKARICDTLTFTQLDNVDHVITFGSHSQPKTYAGETELHLRKGRGETITLNQSGTYQYYDLLNPETAGYFTVVK